jgi:hypothetical protein
VRRVLGGLLCAWLAHAAAEPQLTPFTGTYAIQHGAMQIGESTFALRVGGANSYVLESRTNPKGVAKLMVGAITETSEFELDGDGLRPLRFNATESRGKISQSVTFDWAQGVAHSQRDGESAELTLKPRVLDHSLIQIALMRDLASGQTLAPYFIVEKNQLRKYDYERVGEEDVETPAGKFHAVQVRQSRADSSRELYFWCAPELAYLPVRLEQRKDGKALLTMVLTSARGVGGN